MKKFDQTKDRLVKSITSEENFNNWYEGFINSRCIFYIFMKMYNPFFDIQKPGRYFDCKTSTCNRKNI